MTYNSQIISIVTFVYGLAGVLYLAAWVFQKDLPGKLATWVTWAAWLGNTASILLRWYESYQVGEGYGHAPLSNLFESLVFFAWITGILYLVIEHRYKNRVIGAFAMPLVCLALAYASLRTGSEIKPLIPALKSNWLIAHVITCFIGYGAFAVAFGISIMYLIKRERGTDTGTGIIDRLPSARLMDELNHQLIMFGFLFLTVGIITGAVWANSAWGRYWGWDPKETWSFVTWLVYAALLHARLMRGWRGNRIAILTLIGFAAVLFTYFGVNLLPGLHSYGAS
ncbi:MAG: c-type cytochrome biogenesis protein CcsB [Desulfobacteraceae bacterium]|jgi:cytochrome c-type biogenesis protein CcsB